jgi:hypothetical protein
MLYEGRTLPVLGSFGFGRHIPARHHSASGREAFVKKFDPQPAA